MKFLSALSRMLITRLLQEVVCLPAFEAEKTVMKKDIVSTIVSAESIFPGMRFIFSRAFQ